MHYSYYNFHIYKHLAADAAHWGRKYTQRWEVCETLDVLWDHNTKIQNEVHLKMPSYRLKCLDFWVWFWCTWLSHTGNGWITHDRKKLLMDVQYLRKKEFVCWVFGAIILQLFKYFDDLVFFPVNTRQYGHILSSKCQNRALDND